MRMKPVSRKIAVILVCLILTCCLAPAILAQVEREVAVDALWYASNNKEYFGGTSRVYINIWPNPRESLRLGFFEGIAGGTGMMWRSSGWMAGVLSSLILNQDLSKYRIAFDVGGRVDGPSAGGLMTVGLLAALLGHEVRPDASMTGIINPDGTIGPVGGIPHKIDGAARAGKKLILIPIGQRYDYDMARQAYVDVVARGAEQGVEVREVGDIYQAYRLLTGQELPRPAGISTFEPRLPSRAMEGYLKAARGMEERYSALANWYSNLPASQQNADIRQMMQQAEEKARAASNYIRQGLPVIAYQRMFEAAMQAENARLYSDLLHLFSGNSAGQIKTRIIDYLKRQQQVEKRFEEVFNQFYEVEIQTHGDLGTLADAYSMMVQAYGCYILASSRMADVESLFEKVEKASGTGNTYGSSSAGNSIMGLTVGPSSYGYGVEIKAIDPSSPWWQAGFQVGDIIVEINYEYYIDNVNTFMQLMSGVGPGTTLIFGVVRGQQEGYLQVTFGNQGYSSSQNSAAGLSQEEMEILTKRIYETAFYYRLIDYVLQLAQDRLVFGLGFGGEEVETSPDRIKSLSNIYRLASEANINYFDRIILAEGADQEGVSLSTYRWYFMGSDYDYSLLYATRVALSDFPEDNYLVQLGADSYLYYSTACLVAKYYSLGAEVGEFGTIKAIREEKALVNMLDLARQEARYNINLARQKGIEPVIATGYYELGKYLKEGNLNDKISALFSFWQASFQGRMLVYLLAN